MVGLTGLAIPIPKHSRAMMQRAAAKTAAQEQKRPDEDVGISFEDANGTWHEELSEGDDRPAPVVVG